MSHHEVKMKPLKIDFKTTWKSWRSCLACRQLFIWSPSALLLIQNRLREEHAAQEVLYKTLLKGRPTAPPPRSVTSRASTPSALQKAVISRPLTIVRSGPLWSRSARAGYTATSTSTRWRETYTSPWESKRNWHKKVKSRQVPLTTAQLEDVRICKTETI